RSERERLGTQCRKMRRRTDDAYVWIFNENGARSVQAPKYARAPKPRGSLNHWPSTPGRLIRNAVACEQGDRNIGRIIAAPADAAMEEITSRIGAPRWLSLWVRNKR